MNNFINQIMQNASEINRVNLNTYDKMKID